MSERHYTRPCAVCGQGLTITLDMMTEDITIRAEKLEPLVKDCLDIVAHYRRVKNLGPKWRAEHEARGIVSAGQLITAAGPLGGAVDRCLGLISWLKENGREFDLRTAASFFGEYQAHLAAKTKADRSRCELCGESFIGSGSYCPRHSDKA